MSVVDIADEIYRELDNPDDATIPSIAFWLTANVGQLNLYIGSTYEVDTNEQFSPELSETDKAIIKILYFIYYYSKSVRANLGASAYDWSSITEGDTTISRVSRNEIAKNYLQLKKALEDRLNRILIVRRQGKSLPLSLAACHNLIRYYRVQ